MKKDFMDIAIINDNDHGIRYSSNMNIHTEILSGGRMLPVLRSASGRPKYQISKVWEDIKWFEHLIGRNQVESFHLEIDGQTLDSHWKYQNAYELTAESETSKHGVFELVHETCPVMLKVHTKIDGTAFIERWLEITNLGENPLRCLPSLRFLAYFG